MLKNGFHGLEGKQISVERVIALIELAQIRQTNISLVN
jgi:hypothetical protein